MAEAAALAVGVVGIAVSLTEIVNKVVAFFDGFQNAPNEIQLLHILMVEIEGDLKRLEGDDGRGGLIVIPEGYRRVISESLSACRDFLAEYCAQYENMGRARRYMNWARGAGAQLTQHSMRIGRLYPNIITPLTLRLLNAQVAALVAQQNGGHVFAAVPAPEDHAMDAAPLPGEFNQLAAEFREPPVTLAPHHQNDDGAAIVDIASYPDPANLEEGEHRLQEFDTILGMRLLQILRTRPVAIDTDLEKISGTTMFLQDEAIPPRYRELGLECLEIATRDDETTVLHFRCTGGIISIKHLVPFSTPPYISDILSEDVSFRATHAITLECQDGHHLFRVQQPRYRFTNLETRRKFQELVRDRKLVGEFEASEVATLTRSPGSCLTTLFCQSAGWAKLRRLAAGEPLQVWQRLEPGRQFMSVVMSMTFLASIAGQFVHVELHFNRVAGQVKTVKAEGSSKRKAVEGCWDIPKEDADRIRITFQSEDEATQFADLFAMATQPPSLPPIKAERPDEDWRIQ